MDKNDHAATPATSTPLTQENAEYLVGEIIRTKGMSTNGMVNDANKLPSVLAALEQCGLQKGLHFNIRITDYSNDPDNTPPYRSYGIIEVINSEQFPPAFVEAAWKYINAQHTQPESPDQRPHPEWMESMPDGSWRTGRGERPVNGEHHGEDIPEVKGIIINSHTRHQNPEHAALAKV